MLLRKPFGFDVICHLATLISSIATNKPIDHKTILISEISDL